MYKSLVAKSHVGVTTFKDQINQFLTDIGWTVHDDQSGSEYIVYKTTGESGTQPPGYLQMLWGAASTDPNYIQFWAFYHWDNTSHTGYGKSNYTQALKTASGSTYFAWLYGDKDKVFLRTLVQTDVSSVMVGFLDQKFSETLTDLTSDATAGSNVDLAVTDESGFHVGQDYQVYSVVGEGRDKVTVTSVSPGHIVVDTLPTSVSAGSLIGFLPSSFFIYGYSPLHGTSGVILSPSSDASGTNNISGNDGYINVRYMFVVSNPSSYERRAGGKRVLYPYFVTAQHMVPGYITHDFLCVNDDDVTEEDVITVGIPESGSATSATSTTLVDTTKSWTTDQQKDRYIVVYSGTGYGQTRKITGNDSNSVTVSAWDTIPDATSYYRIVDSVYRIFYAVYLSGLLTAIREEL